MKLGGGVEPSDHREYGYATVKLAGSDPLLKGLTKEGAELNVWMSHGDRVEKLPPGFAAIASSANSPLAAMADVKRKIYGLQFHPEVTHTEHGLEIIRRFALEICGCEPSWTAKNIIAKHLGANVIRANAETEFLAALDGVADPEGKRKIIGRMFIEVFDREAAKLKD